MMTGEKRSRSRKAASDNRAISDRLMPRICASKTRGSCLRRPSHAHQASPGSSSAISARTVTGGAPLPC